MCVCVCVCSRTHMYKPCLVYPFIHQHLSCLCPLAPMNTGYKYWYLLMQKRLCLLHRWAGQGLLTNFLTEVTHLGSNRIQAHKVLNGGEVFAYPMTLRRDFRTEEPELTRREQMPHKQWPIWKVTPVWQMKTQIKKKIASSFVIAMWGQEQFFFIFYFTGVWGKVGDVRE